MTAMRRQCRRRLDMVIGQIWINANPELRGHLRKANEERSAAYYANWRTITAPFRGLIEVLRRARRERETYRELSRFSDCMLNDIGISRSEIGSVAQAVAVGSAEDGMTIAELRQIQRTASAGRDAHVVPLSRAEQRRSRGGAWVTPQSTAAVSPVRDRAAS
jgi:uncharacterized protein YjiS (DUF1127 family)